MNPFPDLPPLTVLAHFAPHTRGLSWRRVPGGFSGSEVWRGDEAGTPRLALKGWPEGVAAERLEQIHAWVAQASRMPFVPAIRSGENGRAVCVEAGRAWDCCSWLPGQPLHTPSASQTEQACEAVARLHEAWAASTARGPCPGVQNRLRILAENEPLLRAGPEALPAVSPQLDPLLRRAVSVAARCAPRLASALRAWEHERFTLHPCVRDLRGEHVLFERGRVAGIIDFGAMAVDHPAVDLARLLGDYAGTDGSLFLAGVTAYRRVCRLEGPDEFVQLLAQSGAACSVLGWLVRLVVRREVVSDPAALVARLGQLLGRAGQITHF